MTLHTRMGLHIDPGWIQVRRWIAAVAPSCIGLYCVFSCVSSFRSSRKLVLSCEAED